MLFGVGFRAHHTQGSSPRAVPAAFLPGRGSDIPAPVPSPCTSGLGQMFHSCSQHNWGTSFLQNSTQINTEHTLLFCVSFNRWSAPLQMGQCEPRATTSPLLQDGEIRCALSQTLNTVATRFPKAINKPKAICEFALQISCSEWSVLILP